MAIQGIGGAKAYVITGAVNPQSSAQYWSNLVSSQKYKLWQEAQNIALQEFKQDMTTYQTEAEFYQAARQQLNRDIEANRKNISSLKQKELTAQAAAENRAIREENLRGRPRRTGAGGRGGTKQRALPYVDPVEKQLSLDLDRAEDNLDRKRAYNDKIDRDIAKLKDDFGGQITPLNEGQIKTLESQKQPITQAEIDAIEDPDNGLRKQLADRRAMKDEDVRADLRARAAAGEMTGSESTGYTYTEAKEIKPEVSPQFAELIKAEEDRLAQLEGQLLALQAPQRPEFDFLGRTRQIAGEEFGMEGRGLRRRPFRGEPTRQPGSVERFIEDSGFTTERGFPQQPQPQAPSMSPSRRAELEAIGVDEQFLVDMGLAPQPERLEETPRFMGQEDEVVTERFTPFAPVEASETSPAMGTSRQYEDYIDREMRMEDEARARFEPSPLTSVVAGYDPDVEATPELQRGLAEDGSAFEDIRLDRANVAEIVAERQRRAQEAARAQAEAERARFAEQMLLRPQARIPEEPPPSPIMQDGLYPQIANQRSAEFEVLGMEELLKPKSSTKPTALPPTVKYKTERIAGSRKLLKDPPKFGEQKPEWAEIVEKLYDPKTGDQEDLQNAWTEITKTYKDNRDIMIKAHDYLLYIDRANEAAQKPE